MANFNNVTLMGNLVDNVDCKEIGDSNSVGKFRLAVNRSYVTKGGEKRTETLFIDCEIWGRRADALKKYTSKGDPLLINGYLKQDVWETEDGGKRSKILVSVQDFEFISTKNSEKSPSKAKSEPALEDVPF
jgi:single-strand DNA-binding protein